ncbi:hypothetical protein EOM57_04380 [Candidatus Saccharibacteria bacterium]|nr:hypothetical protein [Candidatus Saccharibacteria bacterium]
MKKSGLSEEVLTKILSMYGRTIFVYTGVESGYRNTSHFIRTTEGELLNFILYKREPEIVELIKRTNDLGMYLVTGGLPVRGPVDSRIVKVGYRYGSLYGYLGGNTIPWEAYTMKHIKLLGYGLARFHEVAEGYAGNLPDIELVYRDITARMVRYFTDENVRCAINQKLDFNIELPDYNGLLDFTYTLDNRTTLHMDFVRSNLLFDDASVDSELSVGTISLSGILDLEKAARGNPVFDIARTLAFLMVDCNKPEAKLRKYFLDSGYIKRGSRILKPIYFEGVDILERLIDLFLVYDLYKLLRQNPYESLAENHHFLQTCDILKLHKVIQ